MENPIDPVIQKPEKWKPGMLDSDEEIGEHLFDQISLSQEQPILNDNNHDDDVNPFEDDKFATPKSSLKKLKKTKQSSKKKNKDSKRLKRKENKKLKKMMKKEKKKLKRLQKQSDKKSDNEEQGDKKNNDSDDYSDDSESQIDNDEFSSDSLLDNLNPRKKKLLNNGKQKYSSSKKQKTQKKEGFSLKELGNDGQVNYDKNQSSSESQDDSYNSKKGKKHKKGKKEKKEVAKNLDILKQLLDIGLCVGEEEEKAEGDNAERDYDTGIDQLNNMKGSKKKGPKIANKLFQDMNIDDVQQKYDPLPEQLELSVQPKVYTGPSSKVSQFLLRTQKLRKARGMDSEVHNQQYNKMISEKARQSMNEIINNKDCVEAEEIQLDVKVPQIAKGKSSGQINNSMYFRRFSTTEANQQSPGQEKLKKLQFERTYSGKNKSKITRQDFFKSISVEVKNRKSRQITHQVIKNSFKVTELQQIEEMRKKKQEKKRLQALRGWDDDEDDQDFDQEKSKNNDEKQLIGKEQNFEVKLSFLNHKIDGQQQMIDQKDQINAGQAVNNSQNLFNTMKKTESLDIINEEKPNQDQKQNKQEEKKEKAAIDDKQYRKLLEMQEGIDQEGEQEEQNDDEENQGEEEEEQQECEADEQQMENSRQDEKGNVQKMNNEDEIDIENNRSPEQETDKFNINLKLQLNAVDASQIFKGFKINKDAKKDEEPKEGEDQMDEESEQSEEREEKDQNNDIANPEEEKKHKQELDDLEAEGINLKKNRYLREDQEKVNKQNIQEFMNSQRVEEARKQFKKLRKIATIIKQKKKVEKKLRMAGQFFEQEAQEGSDNEEHDHQVKKIDYDKEAEEYQGIDLDADLEELIDNAVDIDEQNEQLAFRKYMEDVKIQDREQIKKIMRGDFKRRDDNEMVLQEIEEDERNRQKRMDQFEQYMKKREMEEGKQFYQNQAEQNDNSEDSKSKDGKKKFEEEEQIVDQMNQENLKKYLDDCLVDTKNYTQIVIKPQKELPQSFTRTKKSEKRNTMKGKQSQRQQEQGTNSIPIPKIKRTSSHLNQIFMKNKQKPKPITFMRNFGVIARK